MKILLVLWAISYGLDSTPAMQEFETVPQCQAALKFVTEKHGYYRGAECVTIDRVGRITSVSGGDQP
jgi:hypothetical protein